jgi:hypothetical protein
MSTKVHLVARGDGVRWSTSAQAGWTAREFDDGAWRTTSKEVQCPPAGSALFARRQFDVGPAFASYRTVTLELDHIGEYVAWLNGVRVQAGHAGGAAMISIPDGLLRARDNVLALELHPLATLATLRLQPQLGGHKDGAQPAARVVKGPYLLAPTTDAITVSWETAGEAASTLVVDGRRFDGGSARHHSVHVTDLQPSRTYPYHVEAGGEATEEAELRTAARPGERVRFVVYGDNRTNGDAHRRVSQAIAAEQPDFLLNTGDLVAQSSENEWQTFFDIEYPILLSTPLYPALGNHESNSGGGGRFAELFPLGRKDLFDGRVYAADFGDVHVAVLDSNAALDEQARWLDRDLQQAEARGAKHLFVVMHWGPFCGRHAIQHGSNIAAQALIVPVAKAHHVDALFTGHDHLYERGASGDLTYFVTGGGGAPLVHDGSIPETKTSASRYHYLVVDVAGDSVDVQAKDPAGQTFDEARWTRTRQRLISKSSTSPSSS